MKTLIYFILFVPSIVFADTQLVDSGDFGFSYIDPIQDMAYLTVKSDLKGAPVNYVMKCPVDANKKPFINYIMYKQPDAGGVMRQHKLVIKNPGVNCQAIKDADARKQPNGVTTIVEPCLEFSVPELSIEEGQCDPGPCERLPEAKEQQVRINLDRGSIASVREKCGGGKNPFFLIHDKATNNVVFTSMEGGQSCKLERRRIKMPGAPWDNCDANKDPKCSYGFLYTMDSKPGFNIGAMVNSYSNKNAPDAVTGYFFDYEKNSWCIHVLPDYNSQIPTCNPAFGTMNGTGLVRPVDMSEQLNSSGVITKGVVNLTMEKGSDGVSRPVAYMGSAKYINNQLVVDTSKPRMKISLSNNAPGSMTKFQYLDENGALKQTVSMAPNYTVGDRFNGTNAANACTASNCLRVPTKFATTDNMTCANNSEPLTAGGRSDTCYSCNGVTPGNCLALPEGRRQIGEKVDTAKNFLGAAESFSLMNSCRNGGDQGQEDQHDAITPIIEQ